MVLIEHTFNHICKTVQHKKRSLMIKCHGTLDEKSSRLPQQWKATRLSKWLDEHQNKLQTLVFQKSSVHLKKLQRKLHVDYIIYMIIERCNCTVSTHTEIAKALKE